MTMRNSETSELQDDVLWGVDSIAKHIGRTRRQTYYLVARGSIPTTKLSHRTITARKSELDAALRRRVREQIIHTGRQIMPAAIYPYFDKITVWFKQPNSPEKLS